MWGFSAKDNIENRAEVQATRKIIGFILGVTLASLAAFRFIPKDLFTTAAWLDRRGLGLLYSDAAMAFAPGSFWEVKNVTVPVSEEAFLFALMITVLQLTLGYMVGVSGSYVNGGQNVEGLLQFLYLLGKGKVSANSVNWRKLGSLLIFISLAAFDTYTDWQFSSRFGQDGLLIVALVYSLLIYNIASEFALMYGLQLAIGNAPDAISGFVKMMISVVTSAFSKPQSGGSGHGGGQQKPPQQHQGGGKPGGGNSNQQQKQQGGSRGGQQQNQPPKRVGQGGGMPSTHRPNEMNGRMPPIEMPAMMIAGDFDDND
jgi:hypothetical protein